MTQTSYSNVSVASSSTRINGYKDKTLSSKVVYVLLWLLGHSVYWGHSRYWGTLAYMFIGALWLLGHSGYWGTPAIGALWLLGHYMAIEALQLLGALPLLWHFGYWGTMAIGTFQLLGHSRFWGILQLLGTLTIGDAPAIEARPLRTSELW